MELVELSNQRASTPSKQTVMRYAIFSDIHGNLPAWEQVLADVQSLEADVLICLGDVVGYGPKPQEVLDSIRQVTENFVLGNHDAAATGIIDPSIFNEHAQSVVWWTRDRLRDESLEFLRHVPLELEAGNLLFVHAELIEPGRFGYIETAKEAAANFEVRDHYVTFIGHTHHPECFERKPSGRVEKLGDQDRVLDEKYRYIVNVGSAGEPRNPKDIRARYVIYDDDTRELFFRRIDFDTNVYRQQLADSGLDLTPYFIRVEDHLVSAGDPETQDMVVPEHAVGVFVSGRSTLKIPESGAALAGFKPKPAVIESKEKRSQAVIPIVVAVVLLVVGGLVWILAQPDRDSVPESALVDESALYGEEKETAAPVEEVVEIPTGPTYVAGKDVTAALPLSGDYTLMVSFAGREGTLVSRKSTKRRWQPGSRILFVRGERVMFQVAQNHRIESDEKLGDAEQHHAAILSVNDEIYLYVDGRLQGREVIDPHPDDPGFRLRLGTRSGAEKGDLRGILHRVQIYNRAMDETAVRNASLIGSLGETPDFEYTHEGGVVLGAELQSALSESGN